MELTPYKRCDSCFMIPTRVLCIVLIILQGSVIDYYLVRHNNAYWYAWIVADAALVFIFVVAFLVSYRHLNLVRTSTCPQTSSVTTCPRSPVQAGSLPFGYLAWLLYSALLVVRVAIIFKNIAWKLDEKDFFGPNTLKVCVGASSVVFILLLLSHHDAPPGSRRQSHIDLLTCTVVFDILDSVDILEVFFHEKNLRVLAELPGLDWGIICIACANLVLPTLPLMSLSRIHFGYKILPETIETLHKMSLLFLINTPLFTLRIVLWHRLDQDVSTFIIKNFVVIGLVIYDFYNKGRFRRMPGATTEDDVDAGKMVEMEEMALATGDGRFDRSLRG